MGDVNVWKRGFKKQEDCTPEQWAKQVEYRSRIKGVPKKRRWTREVCVFQLEELMDLLKGKIEDNDFKELQVIIDKMMDIIRYLYPPVQQSVNVNIDTTANVIMERLKNWKKEQIIVIGDKEDEDK